MLGCMMLEVPDDKGLICGFLLRAQGPAEHLSWNAIARIHDVADRAFENLGSVVQDLELTQDRARLLQEEIASRLGEATNRNLYVLSIVTTVFLPITLITGIFGMNVGGLPWTEDTSGFWWVILNIVITVAVSLVVLQRGRFL